MRRYTLVMKSGHASAITAEQIDIRSNDVGQIVVFRIVDPYPSTPYINIGEIALVIDHGEIGEEDALAVQTARRLAGFSTEPPPGEQVHSHLDEHVGPVGAGGFLPPPVPPHRH